MKLTDLTGKQFGRLTVLNRHEKDAPVKWLCLCSCGNNAIIVASKLTSGWTKSCGCLQKEIAGNIQLKHGNCRRKDGKRSVPKEYESWSAAKDRCYNINCVAYKHYGGRGISMCAEWKDDFGQFLKDMGPRPKGYTLERNNNNGNYEPNNCRWATRRDQANNRRTNNVIIFNGESTTLSKLSRKIGIDHRKLGEWLRKGIPLESIIEKLPAPI